MCLVLLTDYGETFWQATTYSILPAASQSSTAPKRKYLIELLNKHPVQLSLPL